MSRHFSRGESHYGQRTYKHSEQIRVKILKITLSPALTAEVLLDEIFELLSDEQESVRRSAFETFVNLLGDFDHKTNQDRIIPFIKNFCKLSSEDNALAISKMIGQLLIQVQGENFKLKRSLFC